ncbi:hypothetical protein WYO_5494 [Methylobacterium sp. GXF4]|uniref:hypothetical protein n=1 Tax=Methylobacterium sp. GXF4 TaxID=1096546 RepID=UPI000269ACFF|nr:hypothetical protein [Methylobacterium sp. GXF4]EIZ81906.1 hypothetical protein WYO_5494 [Methylobacterium sp. GXF4]
MARASERERRNQRRREENEREAAGKPHDVEAREFADEVRDLIKDFRGERPVGPAQTEAERLAAVFIYLRSVVIQNLRQFHHHPEIQETEFERARVAQEALTMLDDMALVRRHSVHKYFTGTRKILKPKGPTSQSMSIECRLIACAEAIQESGKPITIKKPDAIRLILTRPLLSAHVKSERDFEGFYKKFRTDPDYAAKVAGYRDIMALTGVRDAESALKWAETGMTFATAPLRLEAASQVRDLGVVVQREDGARAFVQPTPSPLRTLPDRTAGALKIATGQK